MRSAILAALVFSTAPALSQTLDPGQTVPVRPVVTEIASDALRVARGIIGRVAAGSETDLAFTVQGRLAERRVSTGDVVAAGEVLALLDPTDLEAGLRSAEAGVRSAEAQLVQARDAEERTIALVARGVSARAVQDIATADRAAAAAAFEQALAARERAADQRAAAILLAPADGVILSVAAEAGATVGVGQPLLRFAATWEREIRIDLTDGDLATLAPDAAFTVTLAADPMVSARATLSAVAPRAARETGTREVSLRLAAPPIGFRLGALVVATPDSDATVMTLPESAILIRDAGAHVWVVSRPDGLVSLVQVTTGPAPADRVVILSGLGAGQEVVTRGIHSLSEGQIVGTRIPSP